MVMRAVAAITLATCYYSRTNLRAYEISTNDTPRPADSRNFTDKCCYFCLHIADNLSYLIFRSRWVYRYHLCRIQRLYITNTNVKLN